jgi:hypothetical protein
MSHTPLIAARVWQLLLTLDMGVQLMRNGLAVHTSSTRRFSSA